MKRKIFQWSKFLFRHSSTSRKLSRQKFYKELARVFTAHLYASKNADWNQQQLTDGGVLANQKMAQIIRIGSYPIRKSPDSGFFACDLWKKCIMPSSRKQITEIKGEGMIAGYVSQGSLNYVVNRGDGFTYWPFLNGINDVTENSLTYLVMHGAGSVCMFQLLSECCQSVRLMFRSQLQSLELQSIVRMTTCYFRNVEGGELDILAFFARGVKLFTIYRYIYIYIYIYILKN